MCKKALWSLACLAVLGSICLATDWPQFLGPNRDGVSPETNLAQVAPKEMWKVDLGKGFGAPAIVGGKVYILDRVEAADAKNNKDVLRCLDLKTGKEDWTFDYAAPGEVDKDYPGSRSTPAVDDTAIYTVGPMGDVQCVSKETHKALWTKNLTEFNAKRPKWGFAQSPLLYKDMVILASGSKGLGVVALDKKTGETKWASEGFGPLAYCSPMLAKIGDSEQVVMQVGDGGGNTVAGLDAATGKTLWKYTDYTCKIPIPSPTVIGDGRFLLTGGYNAGSCMIKVTSVASDPGGKNPSFKVEKVWDSKDLGCHTANPILYKDHLYMNSDNTKKGLVCADLDGKILWKNGDYERGNLLIADGMIFVLNGKGGALTVAAADPKEFKELGKVQALEGKIIWAPLALADGRLLIRDQKQLKCMLLEPAIVK